MSFAVGSLVRIRGREWVVLPESSDDLVVVRPLGGTDDEVTGIDTTLETIEPATFALPEPGSGRRLSLSTAAARGCPARVSLQCRTVSVVRPHQCRASPLSARPTLDGAQARPRALADRR